LDRNSNEKTDMKRLLLTAMLLCGACLQQGFGQDFKKVVDIVADMETSLKKMIVQEQEQRKSEFAGLKTDVQVLRAALMERPNAAVASATTLPPELIARIEALEQRLSDLKPAPEIAEVTQKLSGLVGQLKSAIETQKPAPFLVNGFVDCYLSHNGASPESRANRLRAFDVRTDQFDVSMAKVSLQRPAEPVGFRLELAFGSATDIVHTVDGSVDQTYKYIHQAYATAVIPVGNGLTVDLGQFTSPLGAEVIESNANWHHSRSILFWYAVPAFHVGLRIAYPATGSLTLSAILVNGCSRVVDNNSGKSVGGQVSWVPVEGLTITQNVLTGPEQANNNVDMRTVWDAVIAWEAGKSLAFNVNYDYGYETVSGSKAIWTGIALMSRYALDERFALGVRGEWFNDRSGLQTGRAQDLKEVTLTGEWRAFPQLLLRAELRRDWSSADVFEGSTVPSTKTAQQTIAISTVFEF
jgi:hypothetical protein